MQNYANLLDEELIKAFPDLEPHLREQKPTLDADGNVVVETSHAPNAPNGTS